MISLTHPERAKLKQGFWINLCGVVVCTLLALNSLWQGMWQIALVQAMLIGVCIWSLFTNRRADRKFKEIDRKFIQYFCDNFAGCISQEDLKLMGVLEMWVISERPSDFPTKFVARKWEVAKTPELTADILVADSLEEVRGMIPQGLYRLARDPSDEPQIVETWL